MASTVTFNGGKVFGITKRSSEGLPSISLNPYWFAGLPSVSLITGRVRGMAKGIPNYIPGSRDGQA